MFIQTEATGNPDAMKFLPGREVYPGDPIAFADEAEAKRSPLAKRLFGVGDVTAVEFGADYVTVTKNAGSDWLHLKPAILGAIMDHFVAGLPVVLESEAAERSRSGDMPLDMGDPVVAEISELIETRIRPAATQGGGDIVLRGFDDGVVYVEFQGAAFQLKGGVENMLRHYIPEVIRVADWRDALPKPGLDTPEAQAIVDLLESRINPSVAGHARSTSKGPVPISVWRVGARAAVWPMSP